MAEFFVRRPIVAIVISILTVLLGVVSLLQLPIAQFPDIAPPAIQLATTYVGADAVTAEQAVATPIEQEMNGVDDSIYFYSVNTNAGNMTLYVNFEVGTDPNIDQVLSQMRFTQAESKLPEDVRNYGVTIKKSTTSPLALFSLYSPNGTYDAEFLANYAYINVYDPIGRVNGIGQVSVFGAGQYAMRLWVRPDVLAQRDITVPEIVAAIREQNTVNPAGQVGGEPVPPGQEFTYTVRAQGRLVSETEFGDIVVRATPDGSVIRVRDVARVELGAQVYNLTGRLNGKPAAIVAVYQTPGSNAIDAMRDARALMEQLKERFPADLDYTVSLDTTLAVSEGINEILHTLVEAIVLVIIVVFIFLQGWRATLIPLLAVPVSLVGTFVLFPVFGFSINTISLLALVLAIGIVVDDAIVVVEAVEHHIEHGLSPREATLKAMSEVSGPVVAIALILTAVFLPTAFIPGITGRLYQQFAVTIAVSVLLSAFNALTLSPALSALLLRPKKPARGPLGAFFRGFNRIFERATDGYVHWCGVLIRKSARAMLLLVGVTVLAGLLGSRLPGGFLPEEDQGYLYLAVQLPNAASLQRTDAVCRRVEQILAETPGVQSYNTVVGFSLLSTVYATYNAFFFVTFEDWGERTEPEEQYAAIKAHINRELGEPARGDRLRVPAAGDPRRRHLGRRHVHAPGSLGRRRRVPRREHAALHRRGAQAARDRLGHHALRVRRAAALREGGPRQGAEAGRRDRQRLPDAPGLHGRLLRQLLQPLRPHLAGLRAGRGRVPHARRERRPVPRAEQRGRRRPARARWWRWSRSRAPSSPCASTSTARRRST